MRTNKKRTPFGDLLCLVRAWGLEPQRLSTREPKSRMSTNSIMPADIQLPAYDTQDRTKSQWMKKFPRRFHSAGIRSLMKC